LILDPNAEEFRNDFENGAKQWSDLIFGDLPDFPNDGVNDCAGRGLPANTDLFFRSNPSERLSISYTGSVDDVVIGAELADLNCDDDEDVSCNDGKVCADFDQCGDRPCYCFEGRTVGRAGPTITQRFGGNSATRSTIAGTMQFDRITFKCCYDEDLREVVAVHEVGHIL